MRQPAFALFSLLLLPLTTAILVAPQSQCQVKCGNVLQSTDVADIACGDYIYNSQPGATMKSCMECELGSGYKKEGGISDMQALLYNIRYTANHCIFNDSKVGDTPCITEFACGHFKPALQWGDLKVPDEGSGFEYCDTWDENSLFRCQNCLGQIGGQHTLFNYMSALSIACKQRPPISKTLDIDGSLFDGGPIKAADPAAKNAAIASTFHPPTGLSLGAKIGIAVAALVVLLVASGCFIVCRGRKRRRKVLRDHAEGRFKLTGDGVKKEQMMMRWQEAAQASGYFTGDQKGAMVEDSPQSLYNAAFMNAPQNRWGSQVSQSNSPQTPQTPQMGQSSHNKLIHGSPYVSQTSFSNIGLTVQPPPQSTDRRGSEQAFSPYISQTVSPVSPALMEPPRHGQWGAVPIPRPYRRGSVGSMPGRVGEGEDIEMRSIEVSPVDQRPPSRTQYFPPPSQQSRPSREASRDRDVEKGRTMDSVTDFGRSPIARSVTGSVRSGRSGRSFRDRVETDEQWKNAPAMAGFVPAKTPSRAEASSPPVSMGNRYGHQRSASVESIGEAL